MNELSNVDPIMLIAIVAPVAIVLLLLIGMVVMQRRKINRLEEQVRPKYGFLGKPLYSLLAFAILAGGFGFTLIANQSATDVDDVSATKVVKAIVTAETVSGQGAEYLVRFQVTPVVNDQPWGGGINLYDAFWEVSGPEDFSEAELAISEDDPSGFTRAIPAGSYDVVVNLFSKDNSAQTSISIQIPN